jgi:hypothetical protein
VKLYRLAAQNALGYLGFKKMEGVSVPRDEWAAVKLHHLAAQNALGYLGFKKMEAVSVPRDVELGDAVGRLHLARIAEDGIAGPVDDAEAFRQ